MFTTVVKTVAVGAGGLVVGDIAHGFGRAWFMAGPNGCATFNGLIARYTVARGGAKLQD